jgi:tetratricopeptide (TPR) repeat protein
MRIAPLFALTLLASAAAPAQQPVESDDSPETIVVTGQRLQDFRDALARCLARHCPPNEDADATLALAEALFLNGVYGEAHAAVRASIGRNRDQARNYPEPVSDLYRANTRLARHIGLDREARTSAFEILNSLQAGIPQEDHRHFTARLEIAEIQMMSGNFPGARRELTRLARAARAAGREDVATIAELRDRWYELVAAPHSSSAMSELIEWSRRTEPAQRMRAIGARLLLARIYRGEGDTARADALLAEIGRSTRAGAARRLLSAPRYQLLQRENRFEGDADMADAVAGGNVINRTTENYEGKWIDVGFWILPNGHVSGLELLRSGANPGWADPLLESVRGRLYSEGTEATYRMERYTMTAGFDTTTGSRIQHRGPGARVEMLDLTANAPDAPPPSR